MKKIISMVLSAALLSTGATALAATEKNNIVPLFDFEAYEEGTIFTSETLKNMGITADIEEKAQISVVGSEQTGGSGKALAYASSAAGSSIVFDFSEKAKENELLTIEYDFRMPFTVETAKDTSKCFMSTWFGAVRARVMELGSGGNGWQLGTINMSGNPWRANCLVVDTRNTGNKDAGWYHIKQVFDMDSKTAVSITAEQDGVSKLSKVGASAAATKVLEGLPADEIGNAAGITFNNTNGAGVVYIDNVTAYTVPKMNFVSSSPENGAVNVVSASKKITAEFTNDIGDVSGIVIKKNGAEVSSDEYSITTNGKTAEIVFNNKLDFASVYTVDFSKVKDDFSEPQSVSNADAAIISFTTEDAPAVYITDVKTTVGAGETYEETGGFTASGDIQAIEAVLKNTTSETQSSLIIVSAYAQDGTLISVKTVETTLNVSEEKTVGIGSVMENVKTVKLFSWNNFDKLVPYEQSITKPVTMITE